MCTSFSDHSDHHIHDDIHDHHIEDHENNDHGTSDGLGIGLTVGISIVSILLVLVIVLYVFLCFCKKRRRRSSEAQELTTHPYTIDMVRISHVFLTLIDLLDRSTVPAGSDHYFHSCCMSDRP